MDELKKDDKVLTLQEKIIAIQSDLKTNVEKSQKAGKGSYLKYDYSRESDVLAVLKPLLAKYNIGYLVSHGQEYRLEQHDNMWVYGSMGVITIIDGDSDKSFSLGAPFIAQNNDPAKAVGSADTYAVKFALKKVFGLPDDELDPDNEQGQNKQQEKKEQPKQKATVVLSPRMKDILGIVNAGSKDDATAEQTALANAIKERLNIWTNGDKSASALVNAVQNDDNRMGELETIIRKAGE